jgi:ABC-2 type transport system ATP-binding protein
MIRIENLSFGYRQRPELFRDLSLDLTPGHVHGLLGRNGAGKSTLLKLICGLLHPRGGAIDVLGRDPAARQPALYGELFFVPEEFALPAVTFREFVRISAPFYPNFTYAALNHYAGEFGIDPAHRLDRVSMGQKKIAYFAFALAAGARLLILDEPTNGLDIPAKSIFRQLVAGWTNDERAVLISTHQVRDVENLIDRVTILDGTGIVLSASTEAIAGRLRFGPVPPGARSFYAEESLNGPFGVMPNPDGHTSRVSLELLFNAAMQERAAVSALFTNPSKS